MAKKKQTAAAKNAAINAAMARPETKAMFASITKEVTSSTGHFGVLEKVYKITPTVGFTIDCVDAIIEKIESIKLAAWEARNRFRIKDKTADDRPQLRRADKTEIKKVIAASDALRFPAFWDYLEAVTSSPSIAATICDAAVEFKTDNGKSPTAKDVEAMARAAANAKRGRGNGSSNSSGRKWKAGQHLKAIADHLKSLSAKRHASVMGAQLAMLKRAVEVCSERAKKIEAAAE